MCFNYIDYFSRANIFRFSFCWDNKRETEAHTESQKPIKKSTKKKKKKKKERGIWTFILCSFLLPESTFSVRNLWFQSYSFITLYFPFNTIIIRLDLPNESLRFQSFRRRRQSIFCKFSSSFLRFLFLFHSDYALLFLVYDFCILSIYVMSIFHF